MSFRTRLALVAAGAVALAVLIASVVIFVVVRNQLRGQVDSTLRARAEQIRSGPPLHIEDGYLDIPGGPVGSATFEQAVTTDGHVYPTRGEQGSLPVDHDTLEATRGSGEEHFSDVHVKAGDVRVLTISGSGIALQIGRNLSEVNRTLHRRAEQIRSGPPLHIENGYLDIPGGPVGSATFEQAVTSDGHVYPTRGERGSLPVDHETLEATRGSGEEHYSDVHVRAGDVRVLTISGSGIALQIGRNLSEVNHTLHRITVYLMLIAAGGILVAVALGLAVARTALAPVRRLTDTAEHVTETGDLSERIVVDSHDELGRLAMSFNTMLAALEESSRAQRQLVADASHELRTPLTSLRTNIEVLATERTLPPGDREKLLGDVVEQLGEMTSLITELIELARAEQHHEEPEDVRLDLLTEGAVERAQRNRPNVTFRTALDESLVHGVPSTIERAVANLLDNAAKWSPPGGEVEVGVHGEEVTVRDHGAGIADEDLPYVFDRFYRASSARGLPGSGLGLAIVKQVAEAHGGTVTAEPADGGGTLMRLRLNGATGS